MAREGELYDYKEFDDGTKMWLGDAGEPEDVPEDEGGPFGDMGAGGPSVETQATPGPDPVEAGWEPPYDPSDEFPPDEEDKPGPIWDGVEDQPEILDPPFVSHPYTGEHGPRKEPYVEHPEVPPSSPIYSDDETHDSPLYTDDLLEEFS